MAIEQPDENWKVKAIYSLKPGAKWCLRDDDLSWEEGNSQTEPTNAEIDAEVIKLQGEYDAQDYARKRKTEYPNIQELTIGLYDTEDKAALDTKRAAVKTKWPKDNSGPIE